MSKLGAGFVASMSTVSDNDGGEVTPFVIEVIKGVLDGTGIAPVVPMISISQMLDLLLQLLSAHKVGIRLR